MNNKTIKFLTTKEDAGNRLDIVLTKRISNITRSKIKKIIESENVKVNGSIVTSSSKKVIIALLSHIFLNSSTTRFPCATPLL